MAEEVGFEPTDTCASTVFKTAAFGRSATPPYLTAISDRPFFPEAHYVLRIANRIN